MRLVRLILQRYGHFHDRALEFPAEPVLLTVVEGANEAGKTTALHAIRDLLFGVEERTPYAFRHEPAALRLAATLVRADGASLEIVRRKGRKDTLLDGAGMAIAEGLLGRFLGGADRSLFEGLFGLTHQTLRQGGEEMVRAQGHLGDLLFAAETAVRSIDDIQRRLMEEAEALFTPRRVATKPVYQAVEAFREADRKCRDTAVTPDAWRDTERAIRATEAELTSNQHRLDTLQRDQRRIERIRRLKPLLSERRKLLQDLAALAAVPELAGDARSQFEEARQKRAVQRTTAERVERTIALLERRAESLEVPPPLLARAEEIEGLAAQRTLVQKGRKDRPVLEADRRSRETELERLARELGLGLTVEATMNRLPASPAIAQVRALITEEAGLSAKVATARERLIAATAEVDGLSRALAAQPVPPDTGPLRKVVAAIRAKGDLAELAAARRRQADEAARSLAEALAALPLWTGTAEALAALPVPDPSTIARFEQTLRAAEDTLNRAVERREDAEQRLQRVEQEQAALAVGGVIDRAAVAGSRAHRDLGWRLIRCRYIDGETVSDAEIAAFGPSTRLVPAYEEAVTAADRVADRRADDAMRVARVEALTAERQKAANHLAQAQQALAEAQAAAASAQQAWIECWAATTLPPLTPQEMGAWLRQREKVIDRYLAVRRAADERTAAEAAVAEALATLRGAGAKLVPALSREADIRTALAAAEAFLDDSHANEQERHKLLTRLADGETRQRQEGAAVADAEAQHRAWKDRWAAALTEVGLPPDREPAFAARAVELWERVRDVARERDRLAAQVLQIDCQDASFADAVGTLAAAVGMTLDAGSPLDGAQLLEEALREAKARQQQRTALDEQKRNALNEAREARNAEASAQAILAALCEEASGVSEENFLTIAAEAERKARLRARLNEVEQTLLQDPDGLSLEEAEAEARGADMDALPRHLTLIEEEIRALLSTTQDLGARVQDLRNRLAAMAQAPAAAEASRREECKKELHDLVRRWLVRRTAAFLLKEGLERYRAERENSVVDLASRLFCDLTCGSFAGLAADYDADDSRVLKGRRPDGTVVAVQGMSDGTRDQLYLSLRLAAVARYLDADEALPFIADDLFVHFDDHRARAGLRALLGLGTRTQVLFFTHHPHLTRLAQEVGGNAVGVIRL